MNKDKEIISVSSAISQQPYNYIVGERYHINGSFNRRFPIIDIIKITSKSIDGDPFDYVVGYDLNKEELFAFPLLGLNIWYKPNSNSSKKTPPCPPPPPPRNK